MEFVGREKELNKLKEKYNSNESELIVIYGRRRVGKTSLIKKSLSDNSIYFLLTQESPLINLKDFKEVFSQKNELLGKIEAKSWKEYFKAVKNILPENFTIVLDEFPYLIDKDPSILSQFQKIYDEYLSPKNINLVLCGSSISIMKELQEYTSPLYGRRSYSLNLTPFTLKESVVFLKSSNLKLSLKKHLITGGMPYYLEQLKYAKSDKELSESIFSASNIFIDEPNFLLNQSFREVSNYFSLLKIIANGKTTFNEIVQEVNLEKGSVSKYLQKLELLEYIHKTSSFFAKQNSKKTRYVLADNFLFFWFNVIKKDLSNMHYDLNSVFGNLFESEVRKIYSKKYGKVKPYFNKDIEIHILVEREQNILCIECKFNEKSKEDVVKKLQFKISHLPKKFVYVPRVINLNDLDHLIELSM